MWIKDIVRYNLIPQVLSVLVNKVTIVLVQKLNFMIVMYANLVVKKELPGNSEEKFITD